MGMGSLLYGLLPLRLGGACALLFIMIELAVRQPGSIEEVVVHGGQTGVLGVLNQTRDFNQFVFMILRTGSKHKIREPAATKRYPQFVKAMIFRRMS